MFIASFRRSVSWAQRENSKRKKNMGEARREKGKELSLVALLSYFFARHFSRCAQLTERLEEAMVFQFDAG